MKKIPLTEEHIKVLAEYGLRDIPAESLQCLRFDSGEEIVKEGELISRFAIIISGRAKACQAVQSGKTMILCYYISEGILGEIELLTGTSTAGTTISAISDFECITIPYNILQQEMKTNVTFLKKAGTMLAEKLKESGNSLTQAALCTGRQRLCSYILNTSDHNIFRDVLTDVACSVGMSYRHMFRLLGELCDDGILEKRSTGYLILDRKRLLQQSCEAEA